MSDKIDQLKKIVRLYAGATCAEKAAAAAAFSRRRVGTAYAACSIEEFQSLGDAVPHRPWPKRRKPRTFVRTPEQQEALRREVERRRESHERMKNACREARRTVSELLDWDRQWDRIGYLYAYSPFSLQNAAATVVPRD